MEDLAPQPAADPEIPNKLYFRIGDVAKLAGIKPYVLRFWESEFPGLGPKNRAPGTAFTAAKTWRWCSKSSGFYMRSDTRLKAARKALLDSKPKRSASGKAELPAARGQGEYSPGQVVLFIRS